MYYGISHGVRASDEQYVGTIPKILYQVSSHCYSSCEQCYDNSVPYHNVSKID